MGFENFTLFLSLYMWSHFPCLHANVSAYDTTTFVNESDFDNITSVIFQVGYFNKV